jgi:hypothetical protein
MLVGAADFTVANHAIAGLRVSLATQPPALVHLRFQHNSESANSGVFATNNATELVNLNLELAGGVPQNNFESVWSMNGGPDSISFTAQPGAYWVSTYLPRKGMCLGTFTAGGANVARESLVISLTTAPPPMDLTLSDSCGTLALTLPQGLAGFVPGEERFYTVYVVPDFDTVQDIPPMTVHPSSGPTLTLDGIAPGSYHVYTFDTPVWKQAPAVSRWRCRSLEQTQRLSRCIGKNVPLGDCTRAAGIIGGGCATRDFVCEPAFVESWRGLSHCRHSRECDHRGTAAPCDGCGAV